jgi:hypothetical protein
MVNSVDSAKEMMLINRSRRKGGGSLPLQRRR